MNETRNTFYEEITGGNNVLLYGKVNLCFLNGVVENIFKKNLLRNSE